MNTRTAAMRATRRATSSTKHQSVRTTIERSLARAEQTSAAGIARAAGVSETFLYRHEKQDCDLCQTVFGGGPLTFYRRATARTTTGNEQRNAHEAITTTLSLKADLANSTAANRRLREQIRKLERKLSTILGYQAEANLGIGTLTGNTIDESEMTALQQRIRELEDTLTERDEQLEAVRRVNSDLFKQLNGARHDQT